MLFENNITFLVLKVLITYIGTMGMAFSLADFRSVKKRNVCIINFVVFIFYALLSTYSIIYFLGYNYFLRLFIVTISFPAIFLLHSISDEPFARLVFIRATHVLVSLYIAASITILNTALHGTELSDILLRLLAYLLIILLEVLFIRRIRLDLISVIRTGWGILALIPCAFIILAVTIAFYPEHYTKRFVSIVLIYLLGIVIVITYSAICCYLWFRYQQTTSEQNRKILELQVQNIRRETVGIEDLAKQAKIIRHDTRHMLSTIASLAESGNARAILDYVSTAAAPCDVPISAHYCNDPILDATLSSYLEQAKRLKISLETSISIPDTLPVDFAELSICFANALMSAIKANENLPENEAKIIVRCIDKPRFMFEIINPYSGKITFDKNNIPNSPDINLKISTQSIMAFCRKYHANFSFTVENGWFKVMVTL